MAKKIDINSNFPKEIVTQDFNELTEMKKKRLKIICVDNYDRELYSDRLICENINPYYAEMIVNYLNDKAGEDSQDYYKAVDSNYKLFEAIYE